ncbi:fungal-specific transcription factor domain-containing protein [Aspergillus unguis]
MSGSFPFSTTPSSEFPENDPVYGWVAPTFSQPSFSPQGPSEPPPNQPELSANASVVVPPEHSLNSKVAIPRSANTNAVSSRGRVSRACENCRDQKVKCSGQRPSCQRCQESGIQCSYGDRKREKLARRLSDLTARVESFENLLQNIYPNLDSLSAQYVDQILSDQYENDQSSNQLPSELPSPLFTTDPGSPIGAIDFTDEDFNRDEKIQAMGFVGEHSEIAWIHRLKKSLHKSSQGPLGQSLDRNYVTKMNYFIDDFEVTVLDDVDLSQRPNSAVADRLVESYFNVVHPYFPIVSKVTFLGQYKSFYSGPTVRPGKRWLAILNLIFAIATKYAQRLNVEMRTEDHTVYFSRAWKLSMGDVSLLEHPNLQQIQVEGLSAFYLMTIGQANRSWRLSGMSIQSAVTMGLNLRNESNLIMHNSRETRYRVWWSVYVLHVLLCVVTGRLLSSTEDSCTTPLPVPFVEEDFSRGEIEKLIGDHEARAVFMRNLLSRSSAQSAEKTLILDSSGPSSSTNSEKIAAAAAQALTPNISLHYLHFVELGLIMRRSIDALYAPGAGRKSWRSIEMVISALSSRADSWLSKLPAEFHFTQGSAACERERLSLALSFYSTKILITQPCLSRILLQASFNTHTEAFCTTMATMCIDMASEMLDLLPDTPNIAFVFQLAPWWCIVHYIMQAITIILISLFIKEKTNTIEHPKAIDSVSKAADWLARLAEEDVSAQRAWAAIQDLLSHGEIEAAMGSRN